MEKFSLKLEGQHFKRQYLLYIIEITHGNDKHYYVGQTGDHNYTTARPAFRRLAGHLEDLGGSTQNQIYRFIAEIVLEFSEAGQKNSKFDEKIKAIPVNPPVVTNPPENIPEGYVYKGKWNFLSHLYLHYRKEVTK